MPRREIWTWLPEAVWVPGPKTRVDGRSAVVQTPMTALAASASAGAAPSLVSCSIGHLDGQRLDIETGQIVDAAAGVAGQLADGEQIADAAEIDPERIVALAGEDRDAVADLGDGV